MQRASIPAGGLYAITADFNQSVESLVNQVAAAIRGGAVIVQYRRKSASAELARAELGALKKVCKDSNALLIVNDDVEMALAVGADGVHLGRDDGDWEALAAHSGRPLLLGVSCYDDLARAKRAASVARITSRSAHFSPPAPSRKRGPALLKPCAPHAPRWTSPSLR